MPQPPSVDLDLAAVRTFHGRTGRLGPGSRRALVDLLPRYGLDIAGGSAAVQAEFGGSMPVVLEVGSGMGEATAAMAAADPGTAIIAAEVHTAGVAALLRRIHDQGLTNVRVVHADGVDVLRHMIAPETLDGVRIYFPDPWPKARHHKRRFVRPDLVALVASRVGVGGTVHAATDWPDYADQMLAVLSAQPLLVNDHAGFAPRPAWRPVTRFEERGRQQGHVIRDLIFRRVQG